MVIIIIGFKEPSFNSKPFPVYVGNNGDEASKAISEASGFVRMQKIVNPSCIPVAIRPQPVAETPKAAKPVQPKISNPKK
jgi:hypothetical protein